MQNEISLLPSGWLPSWRADLQRLNALQMVEENKRPAFKPLPAFKPGKQARRDELLISLWLVTLGPDHQKHITKLLEKANREWLNLEVDDQAGD